MNTLSPKGTGIALSITLAVLFALCAVVQYIDPGFQATHMWLTLFSAAELGSLRMWAEGILASLVMGAISGYVFAGAYNRFAR